jgi:Zn-dependent protease with chaperone function
VRGLGPTHRIYLKTNLASVESPDEIEFTIGHELKHYQNHADASGILKPNSRPNGILSF